MRTSIISLLILVGASHSAMMALSDKKDLGKILSSSARTREHNGGEASALVLKQLFEENTLITKSRVRWKPKSEKTANIGCRKMKGIKCRVALYPDVGVVTFLNGPERLTQYIFKTANAATPVLVGTSMSFREKRGMVVHRYKWGTVISHKSSRQEIKVKRGGRYPALGIGQK